MKHEGLLKWSLILLVFLALTGVLGYGGLGGGATRTAQALFWVFVVLFLISLYFGSRKAR